MTWAPGGLFNGIVPRLLSFVDELTALCQARRSYLYYNGVQVAAVWLSVGEVHTHLDWKEGSMGKAATKVQILGAFILALGLVFILTSVVAAQAVEVGGSRRATPDEMSSVLEGDPSPAHGGPIDLRYAQAITFTPVATTYTPAVFRDYVGCVTAPALVGPADGSDLSTLIPLLQWDSGDDPSATTLHLEVAQDTDFTQDVSSFSSSYRTTGVHEYRFGWNFDPATTYYWRAWLTCGGTDGPHSDVWSFTTGSGGTILPGPALAAPVDGSTLTSLPVALQWSAVAGATEYRAFWREVGQGGYRARWVAGTQTEVSGLEAGVTYEWWISVRNDYAIGDASTTWRFTTPASSSPALSRGLGARFEIEHQGTVVEFGE
jgi:hypothetical protein